ncbi:DUF4214 domain-containing protein [Pararhizobium haloflavum]|uniref:DUF4214 domain-containing protein n=1 Tax=Pararhizobium haloflavum TaxID=2037914 RepID=UPI000C18356C|nr:DUF4214 domain-containing protein [Pararhizobium haloflavum]
MAQVDLWQPFDMLGFAGFQGDIYEAGGSRIVVSNGVHTAYYYGSFSYDYYGDVYGTLNAVDYYEGNTLTFAADDFAVDANDFAYLVNTNQAQTAIDFVMAGNDVVEGSNGDDVITAYTGNDTLYGNDGDDEFFAGAGANDIDGGRGLDFANYRADSFDFDIQFTDGAVIVTNNRNIDDRLFNVERIDFDDATLALDLSGNAGQAFRIYEAAFGRSPGESEVGYWINSMDDGWSLEQVSARFIDTPEFAALYGSNPTNSDFVDRIYFNVLDRESDAGGAAYWEGQLNSGAMSDAEVLARISESPENVAAVYPEIADGIWYTV